MSTKLPELPLAVALRANLNHDQTWNGMPCEPHYSFHPCDCGWEEHFSTRGFPIEGLFSAEQVRALMLRAVKEERERCAERCIGKAKHWIALGPSLNWEFRAHGAEECAEAIRSLPDPD